MATSGVVASNEQSVAIGIPRNGLTAVPPSPVQFPTQDQCANNASSASSTATPSVFWSAVIRLR